MRISYIVLILTMILGCSPKTDIIEPKERIPFTWDNATIYFLMTDRFHNGDLTNDYKHPENMAPAPFRGFMGGDIKGITQKLEEGYFTQLGVDAIWMTPVVEQIQGAVDEGTGTSYPFHGYWTRDWTEIDPRFGTKADFREMVKTAHEHGIRILVDAVANHTGPVTPQSPVWPDEWVRTGPQCKYENAESTITCTLVKNLPDIKTESETEVDLPPFLVEKWKEEGRYDQEVKELDDFFAKTGFSRTPVNYIIKWLVDFIKEYGIDGYRVDTVKHTEEKVWSDLYKVAVEVYESMKEEESDLILPDNDFYMVGEVYNYFIGNGRMYDYNDRKVDFFDNGFHALINFDLRSSQNQSYEEVFARYDSILHTELKGKSIVSYISSHDDGSPYDVNREKPYEAITKLLLAPGGVQVYYGDETARPLNVEADGDAKLRSFMNWEEAASSSLLKYAQKLGQFRHDHPSIGAGRHSMISKSPYIFSRKYNQGASHDAVVVGLDLKKGETNIPVQDIFDEGATVRDAISGKSATVTGGSVTITPTEGVVLLENI